MSALATDFILPILTALIAWFANAYRNKQKKEHDILDNVQRLLDMNAAQLQRYDDQLTKRELEYQKLETRYYNKVNAIKEAYDCEHDTSQCPVLIYDKDDRSCETCKHNKHNKQI